MNQYGELLCFLRRKTGVHEILCYRRYTWILYGIPGGSSADRVGSDKAHFLWHSRFEGKGTEFGPDADFSPYYAPGIIALVACTAYSGRVNIITMDD